MGNYYYYKLLIILNIKHHKKGKEFLFDIQEHRNGKLKEISRERITTKDLEMKKQEDNINTIGNTLINILNNKEDLLKILDKYYQKVECEKEFTKELIKSINQLYNKNDLTNIENNIKEQIYNNIKSSIQIYKPTIKERKKQWENKNKDLLNELIFSKERHELWHKELPLEKQYKELKDIYIKKYGTSKEFEQIYNYITELIKIPNLLRYYSKCTIDVFMIKWILPEKYGINIIRQYYTRQAESILKKICTEFNHIFRNRGKNFSFIINYFIEQFINELNILYISFNNNNNLRHINKYNITNFFERLKVTHIGTPYINNIIEYCNKSYNGVEFPIDITKIFIKSLKKELISIFEVFEIEEHTSIKTILKTSLKIPKSIMFDNTSTKLLEKLHISNLTENTVGYIYDINNLTDLLNVTLYSLKMDNKVISKCKNCGRYFISNKKNTEIFCRRIDPKTQNQVSCIEIGRQVNSTAIDNEVKNIYHKIYNRLCNKKVYTNNERQHFQKAYRQKIKELKENEHDKKVWQEDLKTWLKKQEEKTRNKNYLNKYGKVGRTKYNL